MVEGPGCTLNGEKIRSRVQQGQKVKEFRSPTTTQSTTYLQRNDPNKGSFQIFTGCQYTGAATLGKELFLYFGQRALRVHFGMNGSMRINPAKTPGRKSPSPILEIHLTRDVICFFDSTVEIRLAEDCEHRIRAMHSLDVCSPQFSSSRAEEVVRGQRDRMLCDVLLDQTILPGVGNIIKNEALFDSGLHPAVKINQLTDEQVHHIVKMTRDFTLLFYKCRKSGSPLHKHYKVYKRPHCGQCRNAITVCRLGDNGRMTYFCSRCQSADPGEVDLSKLPARNSLLDWAYRASVEPSDDVARREEEEWACELCTLVNQPAVRTCEACLTPRTQVPTDEPSVEKALFTRDLIKYPCNAFSKPREELKVNRKAAFGSTTLVFTDLSKKPNQANSPFSLASSHLNSLAGERGLNKQNVCQGTTSPNYASGGWQNKSTELSKRESLASSSQPSKKMRIDHSPFPGSKAHNGALLVSSSQTKAPNEETQGVPTIPCCTSHRCPSVLRVVNKEGENKGRQFYNCSFPRDKRCNFFEWADLHFPLCNHGKRCLRRTVLKLGPNNGRNFYVCSFLMGKQCDYFQWA
ncbi:endonuclease 8-like 3 isoform X1 [Hypomesus transpacificus]|uniref:endonuclease 8-like 3 isoform X1 n=1 Tax=Hypomesus transpacificus TaxID=137520 RepID=UPI001F079109|nr:endonuclease 8-like 3 isoform X1 [Hypomesus transpacificus]